MDSEMLQEKFENHETHSPTEAMQNSRQARSRERSLLLLFIAVAAFSFVWFYGSDLQLLTGITVAHVDAAFSQAAMK